MCPCGSGLAYDACCGRFHAGTPAPTAEALMRSRYSAYALGLDAYVLATWHPSTRPASLDQDDDVEWKKLQIVDVLETVVEFRAAFRSPRGGGLVHERSRFVHEGGHWLYVDGDSLV